MDKPEAGDRGTVLNDRGGALLPRRLLQRSRAASVLLLLLIAVLLSSCGGAAGLASEEGAQTAAPAAEEAAPASGGGGTTVRAVLPEDVLSEEEQTGMPEFKDWNDTSTEAEPIQIGGTGSAGPIPAVKPFNFGRDPGGPEDKTLYVSIPKLGLEDVPVFDSLKE
ncbi:MAG: hypothetical protein M3Q49_08550, partial [Actinomycetota bacterium]|nr:hypothetical protein [Actinomycetota bacterium]